MIDDAIETHIRALLAVAYPAVVENQIIVKFAKATFGKGKTRTGHTKSRPNILGSETINTIAIIDTEDKLDRVLFLKLLASSVELEGQSVGQVYKSMTNSNKLEVINFKGLLIQIDYIHEILKT